MQDQVCPASITSVTETVASAIEQKQGLPGTADTLTGMPDNEEPSTTAVGAQDQQSPESTDTVTELIAERKPHKHVMTSGEGLFKSLFATPPNSPGSVASSGTLIDPSSRKVSPLGLGTLTKGSPTAVKDFAYPSPDNIRVDSVAMIEEETKKGLLKQLKKKKAAEEKAFRKSEKLAARTKTLSADLKSAKAMVEDREAQADLAKVHANAMTMSNVVLRQIMKDICHGLSHDDNGAQAQRTASEGQSESDPLEEKSLQMHLRSVDESSASAYGRMARLENASAVRGQDSNNTSGQESIQQESPSLIDEFAVQKESESVAVQPPSQQASEEVQTEVVTSSSSTNTSEEAQPETTVEESEARPKEEVEGFFEKYGFDLADLSQILDSVTPTSLEESEKKGTEEVTQEEEALQEVEDHKVEPLADEAVMTPLQEYQRRDLNLDEESDADRSQAMADQIATDFEDAMPNQDGPNESNDEDQVFATDEDMTLSTALNLASDCNKVPATTEPTTNTIPSQGYPNAIGSGRGLTESYEFSEPAGPATLWGLLRSDQTKNEANNITEAGDDATDGNATSEDATGEDAPGEGAAGVLEPAGPATLWGILQSNQDKNGAEDNADAGEDTAGVPEAADPSVESSLSEHDANDNAIADEETAGAPDAADPSVESSLSEHDANDNAIAGEETAGAPDAAGPALLWGILESEQGENAAEDREVVSEEAAGTSGAADPALLRGIVQPEQDEDEIEQHGVADEAVDVSDEEAPGPATLWGILRSDRETPTHDSHDSESNGFAGVQNVHNQDGAELTGLLDDSHSPNYNDDTNGVNDVPDHEEEPSVVSNAPTIAENPASSPHGSDDDDVIAVQEVDTQDVASSPHASDDDDVIAVQEVGTQEVITEIKSLIGVESQTNTVETVTDPIEGSKVVQVSECELEHVTTEVLDLHETTTPVDAVAPVGAAEAANECACDVTGAQKEDQEEQDAEEANASEVNATLGQLENGYEKEELHLAGNDAITGTYLPQEATADEKEGLKEGKTLDGSTTTGNLQTTCEEDMDDQKVAIGISSIPSEGSNADSAVVPAQNPSPSSPSYPRASPEFQVENFDFVGPAPKAKRVKDPEKRRLERARRNAKLKEEKALRRQMEYEAANTPEAVAQREAEEIKKLGDKRLKLQEARGQKWSELKLPEE